jgi:hypothetical protein
VPSVQKESWAMKEDWTKIRKIRGGHSYWRRIRNGASEVGIADDSGTYPENCEPADRPPLLLDQSRPVRIGDSHCWVPLKHEDNSTSSTPTGGYEALWVAMTFEMQIEVEEKGGAIIRARIEAAP